MDKSGGERTTYTNINVILDGATAKTETDLQTEQQITFRDKLRNGTAKTLNLRRRNN